MCIFFIPKYNATGLFFHHSFEFSAIVLAIPGIHEMLDLKEVGGNVLLDLMVPKRQVHKFFGFWQM